MGGVTVLRGVVPKSGYGSGSGSGYGYGDGYGYGYGYWLACLRTLTKAWPEPQRERYEAVVREGATIAFWRSHPDGTPANGGSGAARQVGMVEEVSGPLALCGSRALHATIEPGKWKGAKVWIVALFGEVQWQDDKCGALKREILGEAWCNDE